MRPKRLLNAAGILLALGVSLLVARHFLRSGWPLHGANLWLVALAALILLAAYAFKAWGWQRLFHQESRPGVLTLAAAGGAASVGGIALPGRCDELIRIAVVRRGPGRRASLGAVVLSLFVLGLIDSAALAPLATVAAALTTASGLVRIALIVVAVAGIGATLVVLGLPRLSRLRFLSRFQVVDWVAEHATGPREASKAWALVSASWALRSIAVFVLLAALGMGNSFALALAFLCASSASAVLPVAPAGAATQAGAGAAILVASGVHGEQAIAFAVSAQALLMAVGAVYVLAMGAAHAGARLRPAFR